MNEPLGRESGKQPLYGPLLKMQLHHLIGYNTWVLKDHRTNGRGSAPFPKLLIAWPGYPKAVHGFGPSRIGPLALIYSGEDALSAIRITRGILQGIGTENLKRTGNRRAKVVLRERDCLLGILQHGAQFLNLLAQFGLALSGCL